MKSSLLSTCILLLLLPLLPLCSIAGTFRQFPDQEMSLVIPNGFTELKDDRVPTGALAAYVNGDINDGAAHTVISIEMMQGLIAPDSHIEIEQIPQNLRKSGFTIGRMRWNGHIVDSIDGIITSNGIKMATIAAQIPLAPRAIQINFAGPIEEKESITKIANQVVASVIGPSNWDGPVVRKLTTEERIQKLIGGLIGMVIVCAVAIFIYRSFKNKRPPNKGTG